MQQSWITGWWLTSSCCTRVWHAITSQCIRPIVSRGWGVYGFSLAQVYHPFCKHYAKAINLPQTIFSRTFSSFLVTSDYCSITVSHCTCNLLKTLLTPLPASTYLWKDLGRPLVTLITVMTKHLTEAAHGRKVCCGSQSAGRVSRGRILV